MATEDLPSFIAAERRTALRPFYCYAFRDDGDSTSNFLTNAEQGATIASIPAKWNAADPQAFTASAIRHGAIELQNGLRSADFTVEVRVSDLTPISRYLIYGTIPKIEVGVIKISPGAVTAEKTAEWDEDTALIHSGIVTAIAVQGYTVQMTCRPEPMLASHVVPRWRFSRTCNHPLYSTECGIDPTAHQHSNAITAVNIGKKQLTISGQKAGVNGNYWRQGFLTHTPTGLRIPIRKGEHDGGNTVVKLEQWAPDLEVGDNCVLTAGCNHTEGQCRKRFDNLANFGGFPQVPNKNITIHGVE